jgi:pyruvyltransferase
MFAIHDESKRLEKPVTFADPYWAAAAEAALRALDEADHVLVPAEFLELDPRFAPLEFAWGLEGEARLAWCCSKDDVDRVAPWLLDGRVDDSFYQWANEVFVVGAAFRWRRPPDAESKRHLTAWFERVEQYRRGVEARASNERAASAAGGDRRVLVIGASAMGNVGDDLLAGVLTEMLGAAGADVSLAGPDVDPLRVASYDALVVGGGGLVYASRNGQNEAQNVANYLKFGPIARRCGVPAALIGVGDQDHAGGIDRDPLTKRFVAAALAQFSHVTARDAQSADFLARHGAVGPKAGSDLLFRWRGRARSAVKPTAVQPDRVAFAGELFRFRTIADGFAKGGPLAACAEDADVDVLVMSDDDVEHAQKMQEVLTKAGASAAVVDLRDRDFAALVFLFASYSAVVTTRFHGLVMAALAETPVLALDVAEGKCARLLRSVGAARALAVDGEADGARRIEAALTGALEPLPAATLDELERQTAVHENALQALLGRAEPTGAARSSQRPASPWPAQGAVPLCWAASTAETNGFANLGDSLSAVMVAALSGRRVRHTSFDDRATKLVAVGSIGHAIKHGTAVVWGAGVSIRGGVLAESVPLTRYDVRAMRGRISAQHYRDFSISVPDVYGDPVWLLPSVVHGPVEKKYELGVIPHIRDVADHHPDAPARADSLRYFVDAGEARDVVVINTWHEPTWEGLLAKINLIRSCKRIASQSFHGVVIAEAYGIPALNFRYLSGADNGPVRVDLRERCKTDPRVWEFYEAGGGIDFHMYSQHRDARSDWSAVMRAIDDYWSPFRYDAASFVEAFPLPLAYDPLRERVPKFDNLKELRF